MKYLEIEEQLTEDEKIEQLPEMMRVEVLDEDEAISKMAELKDIIQNSKCFLHEHYHYADSTLNKPCVKKELTELTELEEIER